MRIALVNKCHPQRGEAEHCARQVFRAAYSAELADFPDLLAVCCSEAGRVMAVTGLRTSDSGFFSECYLAAPVERVLSQIAGERVDRAAIVEFTSFASVDPRAAAALMKALRVLVLHWGFQWSFFTATTRLRRLMMLANLPLVMLSRAMPERLHDAERWGSYYGSDPVVCAVSRRHLGGYAAPPAGRYHRVA